MEVFVLCFQKQPIGVFKKRKDAESQLEFLFKDDETPAGLLSSREDYSIKMFHLREYDHKEKS